MAAEETITVGEVSEGSDAGEDVELPVVELLTGRAFLTGKSGSGKSNSMSVVAEKLLDRGYGLLIVDLEGEYYGLKEEYEILHVGADEECDIRVGPEHAGKIAELALEQNVPIILDVSSFLDESEARELLTEVAKQLFAKEKKLKKPFLLIVEEIHEYIPEQGGVDECGRMLVKIGKRGRKHGLGIAGISQRPADVKKDFITQCDWLVWHRLTWKNDTQVVRRILGSDYADAVEDLDDGECFLMTDWGEDLRRVQFERKRTFDAGATPGLGDFERPDLKSVSDDLVADLEAITEAEQRRRDELERLRAELEQREERIAELEAELAEARDLSDMADQFAQAMVEQVGGRPLRGPPGEQSRLDERAGAAASVEADGNGAARARARGDDATDEAPGSEGAGAPEPEDGTVPERFAGTDRGRLIARLRAGIGDLEVTARRMLSYYRAEGPATPMDAHVAAGGTGERALAYSHNRRLREAGLIAHAGRGQYAYAIPALVADAHDGRLDDDELAAVLDAVEGAFAGDHARPDPERAWPDE